MCVWEVPGRQVLGCLDCLEDITAGSETPLLISNSGTAPYQSFLFSSTLFSTSSWLSQPRGGVSLISLICSHPFSLSFVTQCGTRSSLCVPGRAARCSRPCPLVAAWSPAAPACLSGVADFLPVSPAAPLLNLLSPLPMPCKFPHFMVLTVVLNSPALGFSPI